jgi:peptide/nickel transport system permease protein
MQGSIVIVLLLFASALASIVSPFDPNGVDMAHRFEPPNSPGFLLGTDELGRDLLSRLLHAGQISLFVGFSAMAVTVIVGALLGSVAAYFGGSVDIALMRFTDVMMSFPTVFLLLVLASFAGSTVFSITLIIGLTAWMQIARIVHAQSLSLKAQDYVLAARATGASDWRIILQHLLPNTMGSIVVAGTFNVANAILAESYISYLGYGIQPPTASWGSMLNNAQSYFNTAFWLAVFPGVFIAVTVTSFNFLGDGLRDALDPRTRL